MYCVTGFGLLITHMPLYSHFSLKYPIKDQWFYNCHIVEMLGVSEISWKWATWLKKMTLINEPWFEQNNNFVCINPIRFGVTNKAWTAPTWKCIKFESSSRFAFWNFIIVIGYNNNYKFQLFYNIYSFRV